MTVTPFDTVDGVFFYHSFVETLFTMSHFIMVHHIVSVHSDSAELLPQPSCCLGSEYYRTKYLHRRSNVVYSLSPCTIRAVIMTPQQGRLSHGIICFLPWPQLAHTNTHNKSD